MAQIGPIDTDPNRDQVRAESVYEGYLPNMNSMPKLDEFGSCYTNNKKSSFDKQEKILNLQAAKEQKQAKCKSKKVDASES